MKTYLKWHVTIVAMVVLTGCSREPRVMSSTMDVVTVHYFSDQFEATEAKTREECAKYGRRAKFRTAGSLSSGERDATFDCIL